MPGKLSGKVLYAVEGHPKLMLVVLSLVYSL
jgi:hypothetical protein